MAKRKEKIKEPVEEEGTPAIFLRKVDVIIQNGDEEPVIIKADSEES